MSNARDIIIRPLVTEKTIRSQEADNTVVFEVKKGTNKIQIKQAIEELFDVKVAKVNTVRTDGKKKRQGYTYGRTAETKKAYVTLKKDSKAIEFFESMVQ